jgi:hypothetical protein
VVEDGLGVHGDITPDQARKKALKVAGAASISVAFLKGEKPAEMPIVPPDQV